jgi:hypothetical protein
MTPGEIACRAWTESHMARHHCRIVPWEQMSAEDRADWEAAAEAVSDADRRGDILP